MPSSPLQTFVAALLTAAGRPVPSADPVPEWFLVAFPFLFAGTWVLVTTLLGWWTGHMKLLARYPPRDERLEEKFGWASGSVRGVSFSSALYVGIGAQGLHLAPNALFRPLFHRGVPCIPWREVRLVRSQSAGFLARLAGPKFEVPAVGVRFALAGAAGQAVERKLSTSGPEDAGAPRSVLVRER